MNDKIKAFLQENKHLIKYNRWEEVYEKAVEKLSGKNVGKYYKVDLKYILLYS